MTITNTDVVTRIACTGNSHVDFTIGVDFFENSDLEVWVRDQRTSTVTETKKTLTTDYTLVGTPATTVRFGTSPAASVGSAYANIIVVIRRVLRYEQTTDYASGDAFPADSHETALDKLAALTQQLKEITDRVFTLPHTYKNAAVSLTAPEPSAHGIMKWNSDATALVLDTDIADSTYKLKVTENEGTANYLDNKLVGGTGLTKATTNDTVGEESITFSVDAAQTQITSVGALNAGSITSGFGTIDTGSDNITTSGQISAGTFAGAALDNNTSLGSATNKAPTQNAVKAYVDAQTTSDATTSSKGIASFNSDSFSVSSGAVSLKEGAVLDNPVIKGDSTASASIILQEDTDNGSNTATIKCPEALGGDRVVTLPDATDTLVGKDTTDTLTNKTLTSPKINEDVAVTASATELNLLDGVSGLVQADFTKLAAIDASAAEINLLDDVSGLVQADFTKLAAVDASAAEINVLDGATAGTNVASKALVVDSDKKINELIQNYGEFKHQGSDPASATASQDVRLYAKDSKLYTKDNSGTVKELGAGGVGSIDTLFTIQAKSADAAYTAIGNGYVWSGAGSSLTNATLALETTALDLIQSEKVFAYDSGGSGVRNWWYHEQEIQNGYGGKNMVLQLQYFTRNCADSNIFRFYARDAAKPIFTSDGSADAGTNQILGAASWDASLSTSAPDDRKAAAVGDRIVIIDTSNNIHYRYITAVSGAVVTPGALTITYSGADIAPANSTVMLIGVMTDELDYLPANNMSAAGNNEAKLYKKQMQFPEGCRLFQFGFHVESTDVDVELYYDDIALSANQFLQTSSRGQSEYYFAKQQADFWDSSGSSLYYMWNTNLVVAGDGTPALANSNLVTLETFAQPSEGVNVTRILAKQNIILDVVMNAYHSNGGEITIRNSNADVLQSAYAPNSASAGYLPVMASVKLAKNDYVYFRAHDTGDRAGALTFTATPLVNDVVLLNSQDEIFTDWTNYTPTTSLTGGTISTQKGKWRRVGSDMEVEIYIDWSSIFTGGSSVFTLPSGYSIDTGSINTPLNSEETIFGDVMLWDNNVATPHYGKVGYNATTSVKATYHYTSDGNNYLASTDNLGTGHPFTWAADDAVLLQFKVPIAGWTSTFNPVLSMPVVDLGTQVERYKVSGLAGQFNYQPYVSATPDVNTLDKLGTVTAGGSGSAGWKFTASQDIILTLSWFCTFAGGEGVNENSIIVGDGTWSQTVAGWDNGLVTYRQATEGVPAGYTGGPTARFPLKAGEVAQLYSVRNANMSTNTNMGGISLTAEKSYSGTNMAHIIKPAVCILKDVKAAGTAGGAMGSSTWHTRDLNTIEGESWFLNSLSSSIFSLPPGQYKITAAAPSMKTDASKIRLYDTTNSQTKIEGMNVYGNNSNSGASVAHLEGVFTLTSDTSFKIEHYNATANSSGGAMGADISGVVSVFTTVRIEKLK